jgi:dihydroorotate dehydrogenase electron transfer subunit
VIRKFKATVLQNRSLDAPGHFVLTFDAPDLARDARPGHFIAVSGETGVQILRRPFSVYTADPVSGEVSILFSVFGPVTRLMAEYKAGDVIDFIGPLGGRIFDADANPDAHHVMIGGGYGVPPLAFLAKNLRAANPASKVTFITGARRRELLVGAEGLAEVGVDLQTCTNDGSCGTPGIVTDLLKIILRDRVEHHPVHVYTCGPTPMMRAVGELSIAEGVPCQVSMEVFMPCGIGICMGCAVGRHDGTFARGCTDGPVFPAREVVWP